MFAEPKKLLDEAIAKDAAVQVACIPLRRRLNEIKGRLGQLDTEYYRRKNSFLGLGAILTPMPGADEAERDRLHAERRQLVNQIVALAGKDRFQLGFFGAFRHGDQTISHMEAIEEPLHTPHTTAISKLQKQVDRLLASKPTLEEDCAYRLYLDEQHRRAEQKAKREAAKAEQQESHRRKAAAAQAAVASALGKTRDHADIVKRSLPKNHDCPYCGGELGKKPHADHIYPVSKGGRSMPANMVYVCASCNGKKGEMTLAAFIATHRLDREVIELRLQRLGKEY